MLKLINISKEYVVGDTKVNALKGINLQFRKNEFVSILGQSGCGKTTMLNIIGGLDRYTEGDLVIDGTSTKDYVDVDWDAYRNIRIGFIFQSYNLISHITILKNVEMALALAGISKQERRERALKVLAEVGLSDQIDKRPNQLSGGQMQRVSIARALINNPDIILADEPTGALDSTTSVQIMDMLKDISKEKLIIMVTHNSELADQYSTRIVKLYDGEVVGDTNPFFEEGQSDVSQSQESLAENASIVLDTQSSENKLDKKQKKVKLTKEQKVQAKLLKKQKKQIIKQKKDKLKKTSMNYLTALSLSFNNLMTKKGRTFMTAFGGSIGIIGVCLVLAVSNGFSGYIDTMQKDILAQYPVTVATQDIDQDMVLNAIMGKPIIAESDKDKFTDKKVIVPVDPMKDIVKMMIMNNITKDYVAYVEKLKEMGYANSVGFSYAVQMNIVGKINTNYTSNPNDPSGVTSFAKYGQEKYGGYFKVNNSGGSGGFMGDMGGEKLPSINWQEMKGDEDFILSQYDLIGGEFPVNKNQVVVVVSTSNKLNEMTLASMGLEYKKQINFDEVLGVNGEGGVTFKYATNNASYKYNDGLNLYEPVEDYKQLFNSTNSAVEELKVTGILRPKDGAKIATLSTGVAYLPELTRFALENGMQSDVVKAQLNNSSRNVITGDAFDPMVNTLKNTLYALGGIDIPNMINIYPNNFEDKEKILSYLDEWNKGKNELSKIKYSDMSKIATEIMGQALKTISIVMICFASVSLVVSSIMIGIITYVSVVERTKEIGILRSLGARKFDISNVFNAETTIIGFTAGLIGVLVTYILSIPINLIVYAKIQVGTLCMLSPLHALIMIVVSMMLTTIAGLIPASIASKKEPVLALRTE